ncbi:nucleotidyltransferase domain-containing protein [Patescibacteria group bacterium]|nr:nucleotidyltransferase domain-containing protein [Patescibacteria group bacterium]
MAQNISVTPHIRTLISEYAQTLKKRNITFDQIVVFGSHAKGNEHAASDIDVCVISPSFGADYHQALVSLLSAAIDIDGDLDIVPYTPADITSQYDPLAKEIRTYGIRVA